MTNQQKDVIRREIKEEPEGRITGTKTMATGVEKRLLQFHASTGTKRMSLHLQIRRNTSYAYIISIVSSSSVLNVTTRLVFT